MTKADWKELADIISRASWNGKDEHLMNRELLLSSLVVWLHATNPGFGVERFLDLCKAKDLSYYMGLPYKVKYKRISRDDGGGWLAYIPQLGEFAFRGDGETKEEALKSLNFIKEELFKDYLKLGTRIPKPEE